MHVQSGFLRNPFLCFFWWAPITMNRSVRGDPCFDLISPILSSPNYPNLPGWRCWKHPHLGQLLATWISLFFRAKRGSSPSMTCYRKWLILKHENHQNLHWKKKNSQHQFKGRKDDHPENPLPSLRGAEKLRKPQAPNSFTPELSKLTSTHIYTSWFAWCFLGGGC